MKVGDKVIYVSGVYGDSPINPLYGGSQGKVEGEVCEVLEDGIIIVQWDNGNVNDYLTKDLSLSKGNYIFMLPDDEKGKALLKEIETHLNSEEYKLVSETIEDNKIGVRLLFNEGDVIINPALASMNKHSSEVFENIREKIKNINIKLAEGL